LSCGETRHASFGCGLEYGDSDRRGGVLSKRRSFRCVERERLGSERVQQTSSGAAHDSLFVPLTRLAAARPIGIGGTEEASSLAQVVEVRYFAGLTEADIAQALGVTERTVRRDWDKARTLLHAALR
jgi:DNA-binding NarL/FixJ family response regulator